jgi:Tfp pilus assembly protein PilF
LSVLFAKRRGIYYSSTMKFFAALTVALLLVLPSVRAQENPDDQYVIIYTLIQQGDANLDSGQPQKALENYREAQGELQKFQQVYSDWNPNIVSFRLNYLAQKISALTPQTPAPTAPVVAATAAAPAAAVAATADLSSQVNSLNTQIHQLQADNQTLQAKLKEALSAQPATVSADAFAQLQQQANALARENDLLKAAAAQATNSSPQMQQALAQQTARATQLAQQNQSLQARIAVLTTEAGAAEALREENAVLKKQVAGMNPAIAGAAMAPAAIQEKLTEDQLETKALENRVHQMEEASVNNATADVSSTNVAALQSQISELTMERDSLRSQLGEATKANGGKKASEATLDALAMEVETLRNRVTVDEARAIPYTPQELALFQPGPLAADPASNKKASHKLSGGNAVLVAEAQNYYTKREYDKAAADYEKILQHDANNPLALANLASVEVEQNKIPDADKHIQAAMAQTPDDAFGLTVLGRVKFAEADYDGSLDALERAAKLDSKNAQVENFLGVALAEKGLRSQAETAFRKAIQIEPDYGDAHKNLTIFYLTANPPMVELARWHYEKALAAGVAPSPDLQIMLDQDRASDSASAASPH